MFIYVPIEVCKVRSKTNWALSSRSQQEIADCSLINNIITQEEPGIVVDKFDEGLSLFDDQQRDYPYLRHFGISIIVTEMILGNVRVLPNSPILFNQSPLSKMVHEIKKIYILLLKIKLIGGLFDTQRFEHRVVFVWCIVAYYNMDTETVKEAYFLLPPSKFSYPQRFETTCGCW